MKNYTDLKPGVYRGTPATDEQLMALRPGALERLRILPLESTIANVVGEGLVLIPVHRIRAVGRSGPWPWSDLELTFEPCVEKKTLNGKAFVIRNVVVRRAP